MRSHQVASHSWGDFPTGFLTLVFPATKDAVPNALSFPASAHSDVKEGCQLEESGQRVAFWRLDLEKIGLRYIIAGRQFSTSLSRGCTSCEERGSGCLCSGKSFQGCSDGRQPRKREIVSVSGAESRLVYCPTEHGGCSCWGKGQAGFLIIIEDLLSKLGVPLLGCIPRHGQVSSGPLLSGQGTEAQGTGTGGDTVATATAVGNNLSFAPGPGL